jgi:hypothetical protein
MHTREKIMANVQMEVNRDGEIIKQRFAAEEHSASGLILRGLACFKLRESLPFA